MKQYFFGLVLIITVSTGFTLIDSKDVQEPSILEKIANASGFKNWKNVTELKFTFNVERDTAHSERTWIWKPKNNDITSITDKGTLDYNWASMDSIAYKTNGGFINDKYWMLAPYQLMWDRDSFTYELKTSATAPISKKKMQKLTIVYGNKGGYTPGDAYDFYFGDDYMVREWVFRRGNQAEPSVVTTWEDYEDVGGLKIAKTHKNAEGNFNLHFTNVMVKTN